MSKLSSQQLIVRTDDDNDALEEIIADRSIEDEDHAADVEASG